MGEDVNLSEFKGDSDPAFLYDQLPLSPDNLCLVSWGQFKRSIITLFHLFSRLLMPNA